MTGRSVSRITFFVDRAELDGEFWFEDYIEIS